MSDNIKSIEKEIHRLVRQSTRIMKANKNPGNCVDRLLPLLYRMIPMTFNMSHHDASFLLFSMWILLDIPGTYMRQMGDKVRSKEIAKYIRALRSLEKIRARYALVESRRDRQ